MNVPDKLIILHALPCQAQCLRPLLTKRWFSGLTCEPYDNALWFAVEQREIPDLAWAAEQLSRLEADPHAAVVRGEPTEQCHRPCTARRCDRLKHGYDVTFDPAARRLLMIDVDGLAHGSNDPAVWVEDVATKLPRPFHQAACWWHASGSAGFKPGIRLHLWFWCSRSVSDAEAKAWLHGTPADLALYSPVQLHYTANPILVDIADPLPRRSGWRSGREAVLVPDAIASPPARQPVNVRLGEPTAPLQAEDMRAVATVMRRSSVAAAIWRGERVYSDRSKGHFALGCALARAGLRDPDALWRVMVAFDRKHGHDMTKIMRPDYGQRTVGSVLAEIRP